MKVNRCVELDAEERYLQAVNCYRLGRTEYKEGILIDEPPFYLEDSKTDAWMMGWRAEELSDNEGKSRHS